MSGRKSFRQGTAAGVSRILVPMLCVHTDAPVRPGRWSRVARRFQMPQQLSCSRAPGVSAFC